MRFERLAFVVAVLIVLGQFAPSAGKGAIAGHVGDYVPGESILVISDMENFSDVRITIRDSTRFNVSPTLIKLGTPITIYYRRMAERHPIADRVIIGPLSGKKI